MGEQEQTKEQLILELNRLRRQNQELSDELRKYKENPEANRTLLALHTVLPTGMVVADPKGKIIFANQVANEKIHEEANVRALNGENVVYEWSIDAPEGAAFYQTSLSRMQNETGEIIGLVGVGRDITERKKAEEEREQFLKQIAAKQQLLEAVINHAPVGIVVLDGQNLQVKWANEAYLKQLEGPYQKGVIGLSVEEFIPLLYENGALDLLKKVACTGEIYTNPEYEHEGFGRGVTYWDWSIIPVQLEYQEVPDLMLLTSEITQQILARKQLEEESKEYQRYLNTLVRESTREMAWANQQRRWAQEELDHFYNLSMDMLCIMDFQGNIIRLNPAWEKTLGFSMEELIGERMRTLIHPEDMERTIEEAKQMIGTGLPTAKFENRYRCKDGSYRWLEWVAVPDTAKGLTYGVARDITDRKKTQEKLLHLAAIVESSDDGIFSVTPEGIIVSWNTGAERIYKYTAQEVIGQPFSMLAPPDKVHEINDIVDQAKKGEIQHYETERVRKDGHTIYVSVTISPIKDADGNVIGASCIARDITQRRKMEKEIARLDRLNMVGEMAAGISHEVRNPLTTVRGFLQMLRDKKDCLKYKEYYDLMIEELDRANNIITEFLALGRSRTAELKIQNLNNILRAIAPLLQADALSQEKNLMVETGAVWDLLLDDKEIRQIILNLARNGLEAMDRGGCLRIKTFTEGDDVILTVQDQGPGMSSEAVEKLGTPFFTTKDQGTGLGLAICYSIIARHNATLTVDTGLEGTSFYIRFKK